MQDLESCAFLHNAVHICERLRINNSQQIQCQTASYTMQPKSSLRSTRHSRKTPSRASSQVILVRSFHLHFMLKSLLAKLTSKQRSFWPLLLNRRNHGSHLLLFLLLSVVGADPASPFRTAPSFAFSFYHPGVSLCHPPNSLLRPCNQGGAMARKKPTKHNKRADHPPSRFAQCTPGVTRKFYI